MSQLVDRFLPLRLVTIRRCPHSPWFDRECRSTRRQARRHERKYRRTGLPSDGLTWVQFVRYMHRKYREKEGTYWEDRISFHSKEPTTDCCLPTVNEVTTEEVRRLIITSPPKSCELDPIPTFFTPGAPGCLAASPYDAVQQITSGWSPTTVTEAIHLDSSAEGRRLGRG